MPLQANQPTQALTAHLRVQPPQAKVGHPVQKSLAKGVPGGTISIGIASHAHWETTLRGCHDGIRPLRPETNARPDTQPFLLALIGLTGEGAC